MTDLISINVTRFNDQEWIESRIAKVPTRDRGSMKTAMGYLYKDDGPVNLPRSRLLVAEQYLEVAERIVIRWLYTRTNGNHRSAYGRAALVAARTCRYCCQVCGFPDVRALTLDHVNGRVPDTPFACLCANCHAIKSRQNDWTGAKPERKCSDDGRHPVAKSVHVQIVGDVRGNDMDRTTANSLRNINRGGATMDADLKRLLQSVGMKVFVSCFQKFGDQTILPADVVASLPSEYTLKARRSRTSKARRIFELGREAEALTMITESKRVEAKIAKRAAELLVELKGGQFGSG